MDMKECLLKGTVSNPNTVTDRLITIIDLLEDVRHEQGAVACKLWNLDEEVKDRSKAEALPQPKSIEGLLDRIDFLVKGLYVGIQDINSFI